MYRPGLGNKLYQGKVEGPAYLFAGETLRRSCQVHGSVPGVTLPWNARACLRCTGLGLEISFINVSSRGLPTV